MTCLQERVTKHAQELQQASVHAVHDLEAKVKQMQGELDAAQQQLHALKAEYGQQETLAECSKHLDGLQRDLSTERQRVKQLSGKGQEVADAKQEVVQANKNLQVCCELAQCWHSYILLLHMPTSKNLLYVTANCAFDMYRGWMYRGTCFTLIFDHFLLM